MAGEQARGRVRRKSKAEKREGFLMMVIKSSWYTVSLIVFLCGGSVVFMGIEGNHQEFHNYKLLEERQNFSKNLETWFLSNASRAVKLREHLGLKLDGTMDVVKFKNISDTQLAANMTHIQEFVEKRCKHVKYKLSAWNTKNWGDSFKYAVSIMSTVGWGVYYPPDTKLRIITLFYLLFGVPIFAAMIGHIGNFLDWFERKIMSKKLVQKYLGDVFTIFQVLFVIIVVALYAWVMKAFVEQEREKNKARQENNLQNSGLSKLILEANEDDEWTFFVALYYTVQTVTTIGFGDIYIFSPRHAGLHIGPIVSVMLTAFIIALFARVFAKFQANVERSAEKKTLRARHSMASIQLGVIKVNRSVKKELEEIVEDIDEKFEESKHGIDQTNV